MSELKIVSLFSGVGGIDCGFHRAGFKTVFATDIWDVSCNSLKENFPDSEVLTEDIKNINFEEIRRKYKKIDGLVGGPPCPSFSKSRFTCSYSNNFLYCLIKEFLGSVNILNKVSLSNGFR